MRDSQILRQRAHHVFQALAYQNYISGAPGGHALAQALHSIGFQLFFEDVFEIFLAQQVQTVAGHSGKQRVQDPRGKYTMTRVQEWPHQGGRTAPRSARLPSTRQNVNA